jgi:hypothetical protein
VLRCRGSFFAKRISRFNHHRPSASSAGSTRWNYSSNRQIDPPMSQQVLIRSKTVPQQSPPWRWLDRRCGIPEVIGAGQQSVGSRQSKLQPPSDLRHGDAVSLQRKRFAASIQHGYVTSRNKGIPPKSSSLRKARSRKTNIRSLVSTSTRGAAVTAAPLFFGAIELHWRARTRRFKELASQEREPRIKPQKRRKLTDFPPTVQLAPTLAISFFNCCGSPG